MLGFALLAFALPTLLHASGFLAVYVAAGLREDTKKQMSDVLIAEQRSRLEALRQKRDERRGGGNRRQPAEAVPNRTGSQST